MAVRVGLGMRVGVVAVIASGFGASGCLEPGSLEHRAEFRALLHADGGLLSRSSRDAGANQKDAGMHDAGAGCPSACTLFKTRCATAGCHAAAGAQAGLDLESPNLVARLSGVSAKSSACIGKTLLDRTMPEHSILYGKLTEPPVCGERMPLGAALASTDIDCVRRFVASPSCGQAHADDDAGSENDDAATAMGTTELRIEAEAAGSITPPLAIQKDSSASGGSFVSVPLSTMTAKNDTPGTDGVASYIFALPRAATYKIWGRVRVPGTSSDSYWVRIDGGDWTQWNNIPPDTAWHWDDVHDSANMDMPMQYALKAGQHTLNFAYRESGTDLDQFLLTSDLTFVPTGAEP